jgi:hypothetical protein
VCWDYRHLTLHHLKREVLWASLTLYLCIKPERRDVEATKVLHSNESDRTNRWQGSFSMCAMYWAFVNHEISTCGTSK